jgi:D-glycero-alpha-D-manno-heptose-7-phosphate kinase
MHHNASGPTSSIVATAPVRVADIGGWTDTWFAGSGVVCNIAMGPAITVEVVLNSAVGFPTLVLSDFGQLVVLNPDGVAMLQRKHPILAEIVHRHLDWDMGIESIRVTSAVPAGSSLGTSASVGVAMIAALDSVRGIAVEPHRIAQLAHAAETGAGLQSGVQDHIAAAFGGVSEIHIDYPSFTVTPIVISSNMRSQLSARLRTIFLGRHDSSAIHQMVIDRLQSLGSPETCAELIELRAAAAAAITALSTDDMQACGEAMLRTVAAQRGLHPDLINASSQQLVDLAVSFGGAAKVNGAGGFGGSVTLLGPADPQQLAEFDRQLNLQVKNRPGASLVQLSLSDSGVAVTAK